MFVVNDVLLFNDFKILNVQIQYFSYAYWFWNPRNFLYTEMITAVFSPYIKCYYYYLAWLEKDKQTRIIVNGQWSPSIFSSEARLISYWSTIAIDISERCHAQCDFIHLEPDYERFMWPKIYPSFKKFKICSVTFQHI